MSEIRVNQVDIGVVTVDVSNVCRDPALPPPVGLARLELVLAAWREQIRHDAEFALFVDRSTLDLFDPADVERARRMEADGRLRVEREADDPLLDAAERTGSCVLGGSVLSRDRFLDKRRGREWVPERFFEWEIQDGVVRIVRKRSRNTQPFDLSRAIEQKAARANGLKHPRNPLLRRRWICESGKSCFTCEVAPEGVEALPVLRDGVLLCPGCRQPLRDGGERPPEAALKLLIDDRVLLHFTLQAGAPVSFGRLVLPDGERFAALARRGGFDGLGREHAELVVDDDGMAIRPLGASYRLRICRWDARRRRYLRPRTVRDTTSFTRVAPRDALWLAKHVVLIRSGRSIAWAEQLSRAAEPGAWQLGPTGGAPSRP